MKKFSTTMFLIIVVCVCSAFNFVPTCTGCKNIEVENQNGLYVFRIPFGSGYKVRPLVTEKLEYNSKVFKDTNAELVINAGYFDTKNEQTTSYVKIDKKLAVNPEENKNLMENEDLKSHMKAILNRTEFRVLDCNGATKYEISAHNSKTPYKCEIVHSIQAGPLLYPDLRLKQEYFVETKGKKVIRDSISAYKKRARTAIGLKDNDIYVIIATNSHPVTLPELADICKDLRLDKAMNFDGGGSTSVDFKGSDLKEFKNLHITSEKDNTARKVKSFLIFEK